MDEEKYELHHRDEVIKKLQKEDEQFIDIVAENDIHAEMLARLY